MLSQTTINENQLSFIEYCKDNIKREGLEDLLKYLEESDFFVAPCSTKYHLAYRGGLCQHSLNVFYSMCALCQTFDIDIDMYKESIAIVSLFHDLCKVDFYKTEMKAVKEGNVWIQKPQYVIDDQLPIGHGEKSVIVIQKYMKLTNEEIVAIRWHMNGFDNAVKGGDYSISSAQDKTKLLTLLQAADMISTFVLEKN